MAVTRADLGQCLADLLAGDCTADEVLAVLDMSFDEQVDLVNADGTFSVTFTDDDGTVTSEAITLVDNGDGTGTVTIGGVVCDFVKGGGAFKDACGDAMSDGSLFSVEQGHAPRLPSIDMGAGLPGVDLTCAPPAPACPVLGMRQSTFNAYGSVDWEWDGAAWVPVDFSSQSSNSKDNTFVLQVGSEVALTSAWQNTGDAVEVTRTNDDCVAWYTSGRLRTMVNHVMAPGQIWATRVLLSVVGGIGASWDGAPQMTSDSTDFTPSPGVGGEADSDYLSANIERRLNPGQTITLTAQPQTRAVGGLFVPTAATTNQQLGIGNTRLNVDFERMGG